MFEFYRFNVNIKSNISAIRDNEGNLIYEVNQGFDAQAITMGPSSIIPMTGRTRRKESG